MNKEMPEKNAYNRCLSIARTIAATIRADKHEASYRNGEFIVDGQRIEFEITPEFGVNAPHRGGFTQGLRRIRICVGPWRRRQRRPTFFVKKDGSYPQAKIADMMVTLAAERNRLVEQTKKERETEHFATMAAGRVNKAIKSSDRVFAEATKEGLRVRIEHDLSEFQARELIMYAKQLGLE